MIVYELKVNGQVIACETFREAADLRRDHFGGKGEIIKATLRDDMPPTRLAVACLNRWQYAVSLETITGGELDQNTK